MITLTIEVPDETCRLPLTQGLTEWVRSVVDVDTTGEPTEQDFAEIERGMKAIKDGCHADSAAVLEEIKKRFGWQEKWD